MTHRSTCVYTVVRLGGRQGVRKISYLHSAPLKIQTRSPILLENSKLRESLFKLLFSPLLTVFASSGENSNAYVKGLVCVIKYVLNLERVG